MSAAVLKYEILRTDTNDDDGGYYTGYGVRVLSCCDGCEAELFKFTDLFRDCSKVEELIGLLTRNNVSRLHIHELIEDFIGYNAKLSLFNFAFFYAFLV